MGSHEEVEKKPFYKKVWFWIVVVIVVIIALAVSSDNSTNTSTETSSNVEENSTTEETTEETQELSLGDTWTVDGQWSLTITSVESTSYRNEYSDKDPEQVIYITYTYENLGWEDEDEIMDGLYFDLEPSGDATILDENSEIAVSYPGDITTYPQETPVGSKCVGAQACAGLNNESDSITLTINKYDNDYNKQTVTYVLDVD